MKPLALAGVGGLWAVHLGAAILATILLVRMTPLPDPPRAVTVPVPVATPVVVELACEDPDLVDAPDVPPFDPAAPAAPAASGAADAIDAAVDALSYGAALDELVAAAARAVTAAPGSPKARYVLACALSRGGAPDAALAQLEPLTAGCPGCDDALANLATDLTCDWRDDARVLAPPPSPVRRAALAIEEAVRAGDLAIAARYLRGTVEVETVCSVCDPGDDVHVARARAQDELRGMMRAPDSVVDPWIHFGQRLWCDDRCCAADIGYLSHSSSFVTGMCFDPATTSLRSLTVIDG